MRKQWLDNLRWFTVLSVLFYHILYMFNNKGVLGGIGGFSTNPMAQPQDIVLYILYPWFMMLLFLLAGMSARYSLEKRSAKEFIKSRTLKLLVPSTIGLFVIHWITGYFNTRPAAAMGAFDAMPGVAKWILFSTTGSGPLWFIHDLWIFSLLIVLIQKLDSKDKFKKFCSKSSTVVIILMGILICLVSQFMIQNPDPTGAIDSIINLYKPWIYFVPFLMGYFVFSNDEVLEKVKAMSIPMSGCAAIACIALCVTGWGESFTSPQYLGSWLNCLYAWLMILAIMGIFMRFFDKTNGFSSYMNRTSYGLYVLHYPITVTAAYFLKNSTTLSPWIIYPLLIVIVFCLTPIAYEIIHRIPLIRWAVLGENTKSKK